MSFRYKVNQQIILQDQFRLMDARLQFIAFAVMGFAWDMFGKDVVITEIFRTADQQRAYYKQPKTGPYRRSVHEFGRGIDFGIRSYRLGELCPWPNEKQTGCPAFTKEETDTIDAWFSAVVSYDDERPQFDSLIHHDIGLGDHLHLQVSWRKSTRIRSDVGQARLIAKRLGITT